jgi:hypothetical protein
VPRWSRNRDTDRTIHPDERWVGACSREIGALLLRYDHHVVWIGGRRALLLTYSWAGEPLSAQTEPLKFEVSFTYARGHPAAPPAVQVVVDGITFRPADPAPPMG